MTKTWAAAAATVTLLAAIALPSPAAAQSGGALWPSGMDDCENGSVAVLVTSDSAAQSDIYSAATLAAALGTNCVIDAGARTEPLPQASADKLGDAPSPVWVVGGNAAIPSDKLSGLTVRRIAGADRWQTARAVGRIAAEIVGGSTTPYPGHAGDCLQTLKAAIEASTQAAAAADAWEGLVLTLEPENVTASEVRIAWDRYRASIAEEERQYLKIMDDCPIDGELYISYARQRQERLEFDRIACEAAPGYWSGFEC